MTYRIERGSKVRCKCFDVRIEMSIFFSILKIDYQLKLMASIDRNLIPYFPY